jgi:hypothetical protein
MTATTMVLILFILLTIFRLLLPRTVPWVDHLARLNAGAGAKAEWMAPPQVVEQVAWDYRAAQEWVAMCAANWGKFASRIDNYTTGVYLQQQRLILAALVQSRKPRLTTEFSAVHTLSVRYFSSDGLRCLLIDRQTSRAVTTLDYWSGRSLCRQQLDDRAFVYQLQYDAQDNRWKIAQLVQELPLGWENGKTKGRVKVSAELPVAAGRDS